MPELALVVQVFQEDMPVKPDVQSFSEVVVRLNRGTCDSRPSSVQ